MTVSGPWFPPSLLRRLLLVATAALLILAPFLRAWAEAPAVAAAADLRYALTEIATQFRARTGRTLRLTFGSSGNLARQISQGAPFELFLSADEALALGLTEQGLTRGPGTLYGIGRIVLFAPAGSDLPVDQGLPGLGRALAAGRVSRFVIANPEHAPYGAAAREALEREGLWPALVPHLVYGENVSQAAQMAASGSASGGIIAYSLVLAPAMEKRGRYRLIPAELHTPLRQRMVLMRDASATAAAFYEYMQAAEARAIMVKFGFELPED